MVSGTQPTLLAVVPQMGEKDPVAQHSFPVSPPLLSASSTSCLSVGGCLM